MIKQGIDDEFKAKTTAEKIAAKKKVIGGEARASRGELGAMAATNMAVSRNKKKPAWKRNVARKTAEFAIQQGKEAKATQKRVDETKRENKARHAFAMIRQGIRDGAKATTPAEKLAALRTKKAGQARSSRAYWGAFSAKERAASKNERDPAKRQLASNLADWSKEKGQQAKGRQKRVSDSIVPLTMDSLMEINIVKGPDGKPRLASGNGTTLRKNRGPQVKRAMDILNKGGKLTTAGAKSFKNAKISMGNTRALQPSKFPGKRHRTSLKNRSKASSGGLGGDYEGVDMARDSAENKFR
jgi:hypothetical protein